MKLSRLLHKIEVPSDWWIFQGDWPTFFQTLYDCVVKALIVLAAALLAAYWIGIVVINLTD